MSIHRTRSLCVDWAKANLAATFGDRIYDRFLPVLDLENAAPMAAQFPALVISIPSQDFDSSLTTLTGIQLAGQVSFAVYGLANSNRLYSPSDAVRADEVAKIRAVDTAAAAVFDALVSLGQSCPITDWQSSGFRCSAVVIQSSSEEDQPADAPGVRYIISELTATVITQN